MSVSSRCARAFLAATLLAALSACGGGGSGDEDGGPPPSPPAPPPISKAEAYRFLNQATFGAREADVQALVSQGYEAWIETQMQLPASIELPHLLQVLSTLPPGADFTQLHQDRVDIWLRHALNAPDQLRQRVAFALSEIMVISQLSALQAFPFGSASYYDELARNAFGNFRDLLEDVTLHPAMGVYLSMLGNQKPDTALNIRPDENFARELMQLFTIGLVELNVDGSVKLDGQGRAIPTYDQEIIEGFAHVYTGWNWPGATDFALARPTLANQSQPMQAYPGQHDNGAKRVLSYPGAALTQIPGNQTPAQDLRDALDNIFNHPNVGPFISRQLIQRLVTSNPSPQYIERVARTFNEDGTGRRGNLAALVKAILLDVEARTAMTTQTSGKLAEPLLRLTRFWRAYGAASESGKLSARNWTAFVGQGPLQAPSVFNFFSPFYAPPGEIRNQGLVAPEMQLSTEYLAALLTNFHFAFAYCFNTSPLGFCPSIPDADRPDFVFIDISDELALAPDPDVLVERVAGKLAGGPLSATLRAEARAAVDRVPASEPSLRVAEALFLVASSPELAVQR